MSALRTITQVLIQGTLIVGRATIEAYKTVAARNAATAISASATSGDKLTRLTGLSLDEAKKILDIEHGSGNSKKITHKDIEAKYTKLFESNDPKAGGSIYLQSKVFRAKERLELEMREQQEAAAASSSDTATSSDTTSSSTSSPKEVKGGTSQQAK